MKECVLASAREQVPIDDTFLSSLCWHQAWFAHVNTKCLKANEARVFWVMCLMSWRAKHAAA